MFQTLKKYFIRMIHLLKYILDLEDELQLALLKKII